MSHPIRKRFGQHFLHDPHVISHLLREIDLQHNDAVIEIGPGLGALTLPLLQQCTPANYLGLEIDRDAITALREKIRTDANVSANVSANISANVEIREADALGTDFNTLIPNAPRLRIIGNLPYNISTPLIFHLLHFKTRINDMIFMLQKEVVERMVAGPDNKTYGRLSVMVQAHCNAEKLFNVPPGAFNPPPKVDSAIVRLIPHTHSSEIKNSALFTDVVRAAFNQRRKTIRNSLRDFMLEPDFMHMQIDLKKRAENLSVAEFISIANYLSDKQTGQSDGDAA